MKYNNKQWDEERDEIIRIRERDRMLRVQKHYSDLGYELFPIVPLTDLVPIYTGEQRVYKRDSKGRFSK